MMKKHFEDFNNIEHEESFEAVNKWLGKKHQNSSGFSIYKIAATLLLGSFILLACTVPVDQTEEVGYILKGTATENVDGLKTVIDEFEFINPSQVSIDVMIHEEAGAEPVETFEFLMILPDGKESESDQVIAMIESEIPGLKTIDVLPIEEDVERTLYETAMLKMHLAEGEPFDREAVQAKVNQLLKENSNSSVEAHVVIRKGGEPIIEFFVGEPNINMDLNEPGQKFIIKKKKGDGTEEEIIEEIEVIEEKKNN